MKKRMKLNNLEVDLTSKDEDLKPFWNDRSMKLHAILWLPHKYKSLNYMVENSTFWKEQKKPNNLIPHSLFISSPATLIPVMEKDRPLEGREQVTTKKIRIYPENESKYYEALHLFRRAYNLAIEQFKKRVDPSSTLRRDICKQCQSESEQNGTIFDYNLVCEAYRKATITHKAIISKRKKGEKCDFSFMSWKYDNRYFIIQKLGAKGSIFSKSLGKVSYTESVPSESRGKLATIKLENGEWFSCVQMKQTTMKVVDQPTEKIIALDPGVRTFITGYSQRECSKYGVDFVNQKLSKLMTQVDQACRERSKLLKEVAKLNLKKDEARPQWFRDRLRGIEKRLNRARSKHNNLITDLHNRIAYDLVTQYDVILLPEFKVKQMVIKKDDPDRRRKIDKRTARSMLSLNHYTFKLKLKWMAEKYGKLVIDVNEAYSSKTIPGGEIREDLGKAKKIKYDGIIVDRDDHGSRNIFIRFMTNRTTGEILSR